MGMRPQSLLFKGGGTAGGGDGGFPSAEAPQGKTLSLAPLASSLTKGALYAGCLKACGPMWAVRPAGRLSEANRPKGGS